MRHLFLSLLLVTFVIFSAVAVEPDCPIKIVDGVSYYEYTVKVGDGLYSISRQFGVKQADLLDANKGLTADIRAGQIILIPTPFKSDVESVDKLPVQSADKLHVVEPKQTLYGISRIYGISVDSLVGLNDWAAKGIRVGDTLVVARATSQSGRAPKQDVVAVDVVPSNKMSDGKDVSSTKLVTPMDDKKADSVLCPPYHIVQRKETLYAISRRYSMPIHQMLSLNPGAARNLRAGDTLFLREVVKPVEPIKASDIDVVDHSAASVVSTDTVVADSVVVVDSVYTAPILPDSALNIVYLLPFHTEQTSVHKSTLRFVEFYRGALVALQKVKSEGISVNVYTFDTGRTRSDIEALLSNPELANADIIIGPAYSDQLEPVLLFAKERNIPTVVPFSSKVPEDLFYPGLIQFNPSVNHFYNQVISAFASETNRKYVIGRFSSVSKSDRYLADELRKSLDVAGVDVIDTVLNFETLRYVVDAVGEHPTTLLMASSAPSDVNMLLDSLASYQRQNIKVWGFEEWANLTSKYPNTVYASIFNPQESEHYGNAYSDLFGTHVVLSAPRYDLLGYDLTILATKSLVKISDSAIAFNPLNQSEFLQSAPLMIMMQNRFLNNRIYLFHWNGAVVKQSDFVALPQSLSGQADNE